MILLWTDRQDGLWEKITDHRRLHRHIIGTIIDRHRRIMEMTTDHHLRQDIKFV